jgi:hypothetical protein
MSEKTILRGITWNHSRGFVPMVATAQRFSELNPSVEIHGLVLPLKLSLYFRLMNT